MRPYLSVHLGYTRVGIADPRAILSVWGAMVCLFGSSDARSGPDRHFREMGQEMTGQRVGYVRVSSVGQNHDRQLDGLEFDRVFSDTASGKNTHDRPALTEMLAYLREGDQLFVHSLDRLGRSLADLKDVVGALVERGVRVEFVQQGLVFASGEETPMGHLLLHMLGAVAEFERSLILERQRFGIQAAKARGIYKGRQPSLTPAQILEVQERSSSGVPKTVLAREYGVSRSTIYNALATNSPAQPVPVPA